MKRFDSIITKDAEVPGVGYYQKTPNGLKVEAKDDAVKKFFANAMRNKTFIGSIHFKGSEADGAFSGDFMVTKIKSNSITLNKA